jgi:hypothetical protein
MVFVINLIDCIFFCQITYIYERSPDELNIEQGKFENTVYLRYMKRDFLILLSHQSTHFIYHRIYCFCLLFTQLWFQLLISLIVSFSVRLSRHKDLTNTPSSGQLHLLTKKAHFVAVYYYQAILYRYGTFGTSFVVALQREGADKNNISCDR